MAPRGPITDDDPESTKDDDLQFLLRRRASRKLPLSMEADTSPPQDDWEAELRVMIAIGRALEMLPSRAARARVLRWAQDSFESGNVAAAKSPTRDAPGRDTEHTLAVPNARELDDIVGPAVVGVANGGEGAATEVAATSWSAPASERLPPFVRRGPPPRPSVLIRIPARFGRMFWRWKHS